MKFKAKVSFLIVIVLLISAFSLNLSASPEGYVDFSVTSNGTMSHGSTMVSVYAEEDPLLQQPMSAYAEVCYDTITDDWDLASGNGDTNIYAYAYGGSYFDEYASHINDGNSRYW